MNIKVSAMGVLKKFLPKESMLEVKNDNMTLKQIASDLIGIPVTESGVCFIVNGRVKSQKETVSDNASIVIVKMGGAG